MQDLFLDTVPQPPRGPPTFDDCPDAQQLRAALARLNDGVLQPPPGIRQEVDRLTRVVLRAIRAGQLKLSYEPTADGTVSLPTTDRDDYLQGVLYWCGRLDAPISRVTEACARAGDGASLHAVRRLIGTIDQESRTVRTATMFLRTDPR
jgi:hypothetical protein